MKETTYCIVYKQHVNDIGLLDCDTRREVTLSEKIVNICRIVRVFETSGNNVTS